MEVAITKMSSKGQIVIPVNMRKNIKEGEQLIIIKSNNQFVMKKINEMNKKFKEDLIFAKRTESALKRIESGKGMKMDFDSFIEEMKKW